MAPIHGKFRQTERRIQTLNSANAYMQDKSNHMAMASNPTVRFRDRHVLPCQIVKIVNDASTHELMTSFHLDTPSTVPYSLFPFFLFFLP